MVFASADFSCFFVQIFFYAHVIGAKREYVALFFFVGQCFQLFGIGKNSQRDWSPFHRLFAVCKV